MSYTLSAYLVDLDKLRTAIGSKDEGLVQAIISADPSEFDDEDEFDESADRLLLASALRDLVNAAELNPREYTQYAYALEAMCRALGKALPSKEWSAVRHDCIESMGLQPLLTGIDLPVTLPPKTDFPSIGYLTPEKTEAELERVAALKHASTDTAAGVLELIDEYEGWLRAAIRRHLGIVLFYG